MSHQDVEELDKIWVCVDEVLLDAAICHGYGRDENAWCNMVVLPHMQYTVKRKEKSLFVVDNMYVWLMELDSLYMDPKLTIRSQSQRTSSGTFTGPSFQHKPSEKDQRRVDFQPRAQRSRASLQHAESGRTGNIAQSDNEHILKKMAMFCGAKVKRARGDRTWESGTVGFTDARRIEEEPQFTLVR